jgi:ABC-type spermidine/putrescine transport system permease subunit II
MRRRRFRVSWLLVYTVLLFVFLFAPIALVVLFSFNKTASLTFPFHGWSLRWYREVFGSELYREAIFASLRVALITSVAVVVVGTLAALGVTRYAFRGRNAIRTFLLFPAALPGLFVGIALLSFFVQSSVSLSLWTVTAGHLVYTLPYFFLVASSRLQRFDYLLEESARDLGAGPWKTFRRVTLPLIAPSLVAGALVVFSLSWDEVFITFFTIGPQNTLPLVIYSTVKQAVNPSVNAISTLLLAGSLVFVFSVRRLLVDLQQ